MQGSGELVKLFINNCHLFKKGIKLRIYQNKNYLKGILNSEINFLINVLLNQKFTPYEIRKFSDLNVDEKGCYWFTYGS